MSNKSIKSVFTIIFSDDKKKCLLIKRRDIPLWVLPGGGKEHNETLENAAIRETKEETNLNVKIIKKIEKFITGGPFLKPANLYECKIISGNVISENVISRNVI